VALCERGHRGDSLIERNHFFGQNARLFAQRATRMLPINGFTALRDAPTARVHDARQVRAARAGL
jgi:hypothetical protein